MRRQPSTVTIAIASAGIAAGGIGVAVQRHLDADHQRHDLVTAQQIGRHVTVADAARSTACTTAGLACWSSTASVRVVAKSVRVALAAASCGAPRVRCVAHRVVFKPGTVVDSCFVDVNVGGRARQRFNDQRQRRLSVRTPRMPSGPTADVRPNVWRAGQSGAILRSHRASR
jgi:hypothetical protein